MRRSLLSLLLLGCTSATNVTDETDAGPDVAPADATRDGSGPTPADASSNLDAAPPTDATRPDVADPDALAPLADVPWFPLPDAAEAFDLGMGDACEARTWYADLDRDGVGDPLSVQFSCAPPPAHVAEAGDCNDGDPGVGRCADAQRCSLARTCLDEGACSGPGDCPDDGTICDPGTLRCVPGSPCGGEAFDTARVVPNLMIALDRSCSMRRQVAGIRKWDAAVNAIGRITTDYEDTIRFGLVLFPDRGDGRDCRQGDLTFPVGEGNAGPIRALLQAAQDPADPWYPDGPCVTNIDTAMQQAAGDPGLADPARPSYVMLVTDGKQAGCSAGGGNQGTLAAIEGLLASGVRTFVVGFGGEVSARWLTDFSAAGGAALAGEPNYHQADDAAALVAAVRAIGAAVASCDFALGDIPDDPDALAAFFDDAERIPRDPDHQEGWDYDPQRNTVTFYGDACERLRAGEVVDVDVVFQCETPD